MKKRQYTPFVWRAVIEGGKLWCYRRERGLQYDQFSADRRTMRAAFYHDVMLYYNSYLRGGNDE